MKNCLVVFKQPKDALNCRDITLITDIFAQANFNIDGINILSTQEKTINTEIFKNLRHTYDNVFVLSSKHLEFLIDEIIEGLELYNPKQSENDFSLFVIKSDYEHDLMTNIIPALESKYSIKFGKVVFKVFGLEKEIILQSTTKIEQEVSVKFNVVGDNLDFKVEIIYDDKSTKMEYDYAQKEFINTFKDNIYAEKDIELEKILVDLLKLRKCVIATAESFTGGNIASKITSVSGSSSVFYEGIVCYNEQSKILRLGVDDYSIMKFKPVSDQVAGEMVCGLINTGKVDIAISTTGIAGPNSDDSGYPVGLCYIGIAYDGEVKVNKYIFSGNRQEITEKGTKTAMFLAVKLLKNI